MKETQSKAPLEFEEPEERPVSPHGVERHYTDVLISLVALMIMPVYLYGWQRVLLLAGVAVSTALVLEFLCSRLAGRRGIGKSDWSCIVTALIVTLLMPATAPFWLVIFAVAFGLCVAKYPFGGTGKNIFNPAAVGVAFCGMCWPALLFAYPVPFTTNGANDLIQYGASPASVLRIGGTPKIDYFDVMLGKFVGPLGTTCLIVLAGCLLFLMVRRRVSGAVVFPALGIVLLAAVLFPRVVTGVLNSVIYELSAGALVFGVVFMANDPATMPDTGGGRLLYGFLIGAIAVLMRQFGAIELEFVYVVLLANIFAQSCDQWARWIARRWRALTGKNRQHAASAKRRLPVQTGASKKAGEPNA